MFACLVTSIILSLCDMLFQLYIYLNCANYWCDKLSYRFAIVCDLGGGKKVSQKFPEITLNHTYFRSVFVFNYRTAFMGLNFAAFFIITNISYTLNKME